eukprot:scaffold22304_cov54-Phaeocystis_antarctica.AAC.2
MAYRRRPMGTVVKRWRRIQWATAPTEAAWFLLAALSQGFSSRLKDRGVNITGSGRSHGRQLPFAELALRAPARPVLGHLLIVVPPVHVCTAPSHEGGAFRLLYVKRRVPPFAPLSSTFKLTSSRPALAPLASVFIALRQPSA